MNLRTLKRNIPFVATASVCLLLYVFASANYKGFLKPSFIIGSLFSVDAFLGIAAIGLTFVILTGGIDLSVGGVVGLTSISLALLVETHHMSPWIAVPLVLVVGILYGVINGCLIHYFALPPFLVTLAGMFLTRGLALVLSESSIEVTGGLAQFNDAVNIPFGKTSIPGTTLIYLGIFLLALFIAKFTRFGRNVYALGGNESSCTLMGLPVSGTKISVYAISAFCSTLAGVVHVMYNAKGDSSAGIGLELDAIAAVVIGGTVLSGGVGYIAGTVVGVLILEIIQAIIINANLNSWWTRIAIGTLLLLFILLQKLIQSKKFKTAGTFQK